MRKVTGILCGCAAIALLFLAVGCGPDTVDECLNAGAGYGARGEWKKALKMAERAESLSENSVPALLLREFEKVLAIEVAAAGVSLHEAATYLDGFGSPAGRTRG